MSTLLIKIIGFLAREVVPVYLSVLVRKGLKKVEKKVEDSIKAS